MLFWQISVFLCLHMCVIKCVQFDGGCRWWQVAAPTFPVDWWDARKLWTVGVRLVVLRACMKLQDRPYSMSTAFSDWQVSRRSCHPGGYMRCSVTVYCMYYYVRIQGRQLTGVRWSGHE